LLTTSPSTTPTTPSTETSPPPHPAQHHHTHTQFWSLPGYQFPDYGLDPFYDPFLSDPFLTDPFFYEAELGWYRSSPRVFKSLKNEQKSVAGFQRSGSVVEVLLKTMSRKKRRRKNKQKKKNARKMRKKKSKKIRKKNQKRSIQKFGVGSMDWEQIEKWRQKWGDKKAANSQTTNTETKPPKNKWKHKRRGSIKNKKGKKKKKSAKKKRKGSKKKHLRRSGVPLSKSKKTPALTAQHFLQAVIDKYGTFNQTSMSATTKKPVKKKTTKIKAHLFHKIRRFSKKNIAEMVKTSRKELKLPFGKTRKPRSVDVRWQRLRRVLTRGLRGPSVSQ
jgi:hypothetical protein